MARKPKKFNLHVIVDPVWPVEKILEPGDKLVLTHKIEMDTTDTKGNASVTRTYVWDGHVLRGVV